MQQPAYLFCDTCKRLQTAYTVTTLSIKKLRNPHIQELRSFVNKGRLLLPAALHNQFADAFIESGGSHQVFQIQMHAVAPIMLGVGGNVYTLGIGIGQTELLIDGQPVLQGYDAEHGRAGEMAGNNVAS